MYWIGNWIGSFPMCYLILDIDRMISPSIVIWNWIWVYLRSCICSKMLKVVCPYIGLEIGSGHFLCAVLFDIDKVVREGIGIWNWIGLYLRSCILSKPCIGLEIGLGYFP